MSNETLILAKKLLQELKDKKIVSLDGIFEAPNDYQRGYLWGYMACIDDIQEDGTDLKINPIKLKTLVDFLNAKLKRDDTLMQSASYFRHENMAMYLRLENLESKMKELEKVKELEKNVGEQKK